MKRRKLGRTNINVSNISFGTVSLGVPYGIGANSEKDMLSEDQAVSLLRSAFKQGINFFDTARSYGKAEALLGKAFGNRPDEVVIATKCVHLKDPQGRLYSDDKLEGIIRTSLEKSIQELGGCKIDLYMSHTGTLEILNHLKIAEIFQKFKKEGLVKAIGISTYAPEETRVAIEKEIWDVIQLPFNLMDQQHGQFFDLAARHGVGIVVRSVLLKGILTDKGGNLHSALKSVEQHRACYTDFLDDTMRLSDLATKFVLGHQEVTSVLLGIDKPEYLEAALRTVSSKPLDENVVERLKHMSYPNPGFIDLPTWNRSGWLT
ncbi:aldo/keto reductase [candidate division KSB1 bacterium]|nr:aldo/keto reductase [candidate division KSB1 bacterium]